MIGGKFVALNLLEENRENIHGALVNTASEVLGKARKKKPWMTNDILHLCDRRRRLKKRINEDHLAMQNHSQVNEVIRRKLDHRLMSRY